MRASVASTTSLPPAGFDGAALVTAIDALFAAGVLDEASRLCQRFGADLVRAGQAAAVERWEARLRDAGQAQTPALLLLRARAVAARDAVGGMAAFAAAFDASVAAGERYRALQAASGLILCVFIAWGDFRPLAPMLAVAEEALAQEHADATDELECLAGLLAGWLLLRAEDARLDAVVERVLALALDARVHPGVRLSAGGVLLAYGQLADDVHRSRALIVALDRLMGDARLTATQQMVWRYEAILFLVNSSARAAGDYRTRLEEFAAHLQPDAPALLHYHYGRLQFEAGYFEGDLERAEAALARMHQWVDATQPVQAIELAHKEGLLAVRRGQYQRAVATIDVAVRRAEASHTPGIVLAVFRQIRALARGSAGDYAAAHAELAELIAGATISHKLSYEVCDRSFDAAEALADADGGERLRAAVAGCMQAIGLMGTDHLFTYNPPLGAQIMAAALHLDIQPALARRVIAQSALAAPPGLPEAWPWTVRLTLLGAPQVQVDGAVLGGRGKAQQRPLDLLKAIAILGGERHGVDLQSLMLALWPEPDADAKTALDVTVLRLRKLLGHDGLVIVADGKLRLDTARVWCDVWAFENRLEAGAAQHPWAADALALYRGPLFGDEIAPVWAVTTRERLRTRYLREVLRRGADAEAARDWPRAIGVYERGLEQDNLAEDFYRGLMRCHLAQDDRNNALRVYRRCKELMAIVLSLGPSAETQALYQRIHDAA